MSAALLPAAARWGAVAGLAAVMWAVLKYRRIRRRLLLDRQALLYSPAAVHSLSLVKLPAGGDAPALCAQLARALIAAGAELVYAGRAVHTLHHSEQLGEVEWDAALLLQHASRASCAAAFDSAPVRAALSPFAAVHNVSARRHPAQGVLFPVLLSAAKLVGAVFGRSGAPFKRFAATTEKGHKWAAAIGQKVSAIESDWGALWEGAGRDALMVCNLLIEHKDKEVAKVNSAYGMKMMRMLGEADAGIMHMGSAVESLPGTQPLEQPWENVACVMYPGRRFFLDMLQSTFIAAVGPDKKQGDTIAVLTAPWSLNV